MRDIAEVRGGFDSYDFTKNTNAPTDPDLCLSLIGSERTISLELPGKVRVFYHCGTLSSYPVKLRCTTHYFLRWKETGFSNGCN